MYRDMVASGRPRRPRPSQRPKRASPSALVTEPVRAEVRRGSSLVVAVSGGRDSMVLLEALARVAPGSVAAVATFDHGTGPAATSAASFVSDRAHALGL